MDSSIRSYYCFSHVVKVAEPGYKDVDIKNQFSVANHMAVWYIWYICTSVFCHLITLLGMTDQKHLLCFIEKKSGNSDFYLMQDCFLYSMKIYENMFFILSQFKLNRVFTLNLGLKNLTPLTEEIQNYIEIVISGAAVWRQLCLLEFPFNTRF